MDLNLKKSVTILLSVTLILTTSMSFMSISPVSAQAEAYQAFGPRVNELLIKVYIGGRDAEFGALKTGEIDIVDWPLDYDTYIELSGDSANFGVETLTMIDMYNLEFNCLKWPTSDVNVRRAIAHLFDRSAFLTTQLKSFSGVMLDSPIATEWTRWHSATVKKYPYNPTLAAQILEDAGYYNDDGDQYLEYHNITGRYELPTMKFYIRSDDPDRLAFGRDYMLYEMAAIGLPVEGLVRDKTVCWAEVMKMPYDYNIYTGGWGPYVDPDFLYDQYHHQFGIDYYTAGRDWANNYVFFTNTTFDDWAEQLKFAVDMTSAEVPAKKCQDILMDQVPMIPAWHSAGAIGYRKNYGHHTGEEAYWDQPWKGIVNTKVISGMGTGGANGLWTFYSVHPEDFERGGTFRYGFMNDADVLNPVQADFYWDWELLNKVYDFLITADPETGEDIPWMAKSWTVGTWDKGGGTLATKITMELFQNILWHDGQPFTAADVEFTFPYMRDAYSSLFYPYTINLNHVTATGPYTVEIYYDVLSCWALHWAGGIPMIPKHIWQNIPPANSRNGGEYETTGHLTGTGPYRFVSHVQGQSITLVANPTYFRKLIRPDFYTGGQSIPYYNTKIDLDDFQAAVFHYGEASPWAHAIDPWADVNKDLVIELDDVMEIGVRYGQTGYKEGYPGFYKP